MTKNVSHVNIIRDSNRAQWHIIPKFQIKSIIYNVNWLRILEQYIDNSWTDVKFSTVPLFLAHPVLTLALSRLSYLENPISEAYYDFSR